VFSPPEAEVTRARRIVEALREAEAQGKGAASLDGKMIDAASERMAANVIAVADAIANRAALTDLRGEQEAMDIHEYQAKEILSRFGVPTPARRAGIQPRAGGLSRPTNWVASAGW
jgi:hypothetical protein